MFERFTQRARQVVVLAQDEARALKHDHIGTEHLLLGVMHVEEGPAARVLSASRSGCSSVGDLGLGLHSPAMAVLPKRFPDRVEIASVREEAARLEPGAEACETGTRLNDDVEPG